MYQQPMHFNMRRSMDIPPPLHLSNQSDNEIPSQYTPITPFDISYGQSMIPSNLLMNSPYFTPPPTASQYFLPSIPETVLALVLNRRHREYTFKIALKR